ncbi:MAG TPA: pantoate--beta-alanine ligase [Bacteroidota bacterium]|nr:pantoate--beta-alanine ligase [Bacteroidota bacterium]
MDAIIRVAGMSAAAGRYRREGRTIGFVPTMGSLHEGHLRLISIARKRADTVVVSVFVNPTQFGPGEDYESYPRDPGRDATLAAGAGADVLFLPDAGEMFPPGHRTWVEVPGITNVLEGKSRPGHFRGVATVVAKLFNIVRPDVAVFGQKDAQQVAVVRALAVGLNTGVEVVVAPTVREPDGLAFSSRNAYLSAGERAQAPALCRSLEAARRRISSGERNGRKIIDLMRQIISEQPSAAIDYISVADPETLEDVRTLRPGSGVLVSLAVKIGKTRLIDNDIIMVE